MSRKETAQPPSGEVYGEIAWVSPDMQAALRGAHDINCIGKPVESLESLASESVSDQLSVSMLTVLTDVWHEPVHELTIDELNEMNRMKPNEGGAS